MATTTTNQSLATQKPIFKTIANIITGNLLAYATKLNRDINDLVPPNTIVQLAQYFEDNKINNQGINKAIEILIENPNKLSDLETILSQNNLIQVTDTQTLSLIADTIITNNPVQVEQYQSGKTQVIGFLVGQCMKQSGGTGNPKIFNELISQKLKAE